MVQSNSALESGFLKPGVKAPVKETLLTPRFYTTDFDKVAQMDLSEDDKELRAVVAELKADYNRHHFIRDEEFKQSWDCIDGQTRIAFIDFWNVPARRNFRDFCCLRN